MSKSSDSKPWLSKRASGVLMHLSSLPGPYAIGDLGDEAFAFVDFLAAARQTYWQLLPINPVGSGNSPYASICSLAGEPLYISPRRLYEDGLLKKAELARSTQPASARVNYAKARRLRLPLLQEAFTNFIKRKKYNSSAFKKFTRTQKSWLEPYCLFMAISEKLNTKQWYKWPEAYRKFSRTLLQTMNKEHPYACLWHSFQQFKFFEQWAAVKSYALKKNIHLIGDIPIFVALESSEVWANQKFFWLNVNGSPKYVAGVPPDYFNPQGQLWGNALYRWPTHERDRFSWWIARLRHMQNLFSAVRIDHFIGFHRYWQIPANARTAKAGRWQLSPGEKLFSAALNAMGCLPFIAEDLGTVTPEVFALRDRFALPGMRVMHFGFGNNAKAIYHLPQSYTPNSVVYPGTHDNNTTVGWFENAKQNARRKNASYNFSLIKKYFPDATKKNIHRLMHQDLMKSNAQLCMIAMQDLLGLGANAKMNIPGVGEGNWRWRLNKALITEDVTNQFADLTTATWRA